VVVGFIVLGCVLLGEIFAGAERFLMFVRTGDPGNLLECTRRVSQALVWCGSLALFYFATIFFLSLFRREATVGNAFPTLTSLLFLAAASFWHFRTRCSETAFLEVVATPLVVCAVACSCARLMFWLDKN